MSDKHPDPVNPNPATTSTILTEHFDSKDPKDHPNAWHALWADGSYLPWDRGLPNPALSDLLDTTASTLPPATNSHPNSTTAIRELIEHDDRKPRALVPGCGRGYDVALLAKHGFEAWGLDVSPTAVEKAQEWHSQPENVPDNLKGKTVFVAGDFFAKEWIAQVVGEEVARKDKGGDFDLVYDYTFLCALPPTLRPSWAKRMSQLVRKQGGVLVCLEFPLYKDFALGGPPWGLRSSIYDSLLSAEGFELIERWAPARTHAIGEGSDRVSVWRNLG